LLASAFLSWFLRSATAGTLLGVFFTVTLMPITSLKGGLAVGSLLGGMAGALAEAVLFAPERSVGRIFIATAYGALLGASWGAVIALVSKMSRARSSGAKSGANATPDHQRRR
jgi:hypothetical protein